jgi:hypothetical protein
LHNLGRVSTTDEPTDDFSIDHECGSRPDRPTLPIIAGLAGAVMTVAVVATMKRPTPSKRKELAISSEERALLKTIVARGEEKGWNLSYDEHFIFKLWPALKAMAR